MKIAQIATGLLPIPPHGWGALEKIIWEYKTGLERLGHEVDLRFPADNLDSYDIVHVHIANQALMLYRRGVPYVFTMDDHHAVVYGKESSCYAENLEALKHARVGIVSARFLLEYFGLPKVQYVPLGVDLGIYKPNGNERNNRLLCVGNNGLAGEMIDRKGFGYAIHAAKVLGVPLDIVGPKSNEKFFSVNSELSPENNSMVHVWYDLTDEEVLRLYQTNGVLVHATSIEGGHPPLTLLEAAACGMPIVSTDVGGDLLPDECVVGRDNNEVLIGVKGALKWGKYIGEELHQRAQKYSWDGVCERLVELYAQTQKKKVKLVHILTQPKEERERVSIEKVSQVNEYGIEYVQHVNEPYVGVPPRENCRRPDDISDEPGWYKLSPGHYGCYSAFRRAIEEEFGDDLDALMVCEADCVPTVEAGEFVDNIYQAVELMSKHDIEYMSLGNRFNFDTNELQSQELESCGEFGYITDKIICCQAILFSQRTRDYLLKCLKTKPWDVSDIYFNSIYQNTPHKMGISRNCWAVQHSGVSLIDKKYKQYPQGKVGGELGTNLNKIYTETELSCREAILREPRFVPNFINGARVDVVSYIPDEYDIRFVDQDTNDMVYSVRIGSGCWASVSRQWYTNWKIQANKDNKEIFSYVFDPTGKKFFVAFSSKALGDNLAWMPMVERFRQNHNAQVVCATFWNDLFARTYPEIEFVSPGASVDGLYGMYTIGCYDNDASRHKRAWNSVPLQQVASDILGVAPTEERPKVWVEKPERTIIEPYICMSEHGTAGAKYWNYPGGWQEVVDWCLDVGYKVVNISKEGTSLDGVEKYNNRSIQETIQTMVHSKLFLGIGSGPSWLAWALGVPVVLISGFSLPFAEFSTGVERIINTKVCHGCFNDPKIVFDRGDWNWCPRHKNFECTRNITPKMVIDGIERIISGRQMR